MRTTLATALSAILAFPLAASAQDTGWTFQAALYGWFSGLDASVETPRGTVDAEISFSDVLENLDVAFMGALEARNGRWGLIGDYVYSDLTATQGTPFGLAFSEARVESTTSVFSGYAMYRAVQTPNVALDLGGGFRWIGLDSKTTLTPGTLPGQSFDSSDDWANPLIAGRLIVPFNDKWYGMALADVGGYLTQDSSTWQAVGAIAYNFNQRWSAHLGYRYMQIENEIDGRNVTLDLSGPLLGVSVRF